MLAITFTQEERAMLGGWIGRERGYLLSCKVLSGYAVIPGVTGTADSIDNDLDFINRIRSSIRDQEKVTMLSGEDADWLLQMAQANRFPDKAAFWNAVEKKLQGAMLGEGKSGD